MIRTYLFFVLLLSSTSICSAQDLEVEGKLTIANPSDPDGSEIKAPTAAIRSVVTDHLVVRDRAIINTPLSTKKLTTVNGGDIFSSGNLYAEGGMDFGSSHVLQVKKFSLQTPSQADTTSSILHGLEAADFVRVTGFVYHMPDRGINPGYLFGNGFEYYIRWTPTGLEVITTESNSGKVLDKPCEITIFYKN